MLRKKSRKSLIITQIVLIFILPIFLLYFEIIPKESRFFLICFSSLILYGIVKHEKWTYQDMGIRLNNFKKSTLPYIVFTAVGVLILFLVAKIFDISTVNNREIVLQRFLLFIPLSFFQEFAYRSFLIKRLQMLGSNKFWVICINAFLFMLLHSIYPDSAIMFPVSFFGGIAFAYIYLKYPNLTLIGIVHSILNLTAVLLGFFIL